jgi:aminoglycoside phosphotransferase (APT) family kinase protein
MFAQVEPKLAAIIDWELSTLGDPLLDLAWMLTAWHEDDDPPGHGERTALWDRMPSRQEVIDHYGAVSGRSVDDMPWFFVLACYKLGILLEGSYARALAGQSAMDMGLTLHRIATWLFLKGAQTIAA